MNPLSLRRPNTTGWGAIAFGLTLMLIGGGWTPTSHAETAYISDRLTVPLRSGPSNRHRIVHQGLPVGTKMEVLQKDDASDYVEIQTARGTRGWMQEQYVTSKPIARDLLRTAQAEITRLEKSLGEQQKALGQARSQGAERGQTNAQLTNQLAKVTEEFEALQGVSKNAVAEHAENRKLKELNSRLREELEDINEERDQLRSNVQQRWLMYGGGLVLMGLLLGILLKSRPRRSAWT